VLLWQLFKGVWRVTTKGDHGGIDEGDWRRTEKDGVIEERGRRRINKTRVLWVQNRLETEEGGEHCGHLSCAWLIKWQGKKGREPRLNLQSGVKGPKKWRTNKPDLRETELGLKLCEEQKEDGKEVGEMGKMDRGWMKKRIGPTWDEEAKTDWVKTPRRELDCSLTRREKDSFEGEGYLRAGLPLTFLFHKWSNSSLFFNFFYLIFQIPTKQKNKLKF